ncbi:DUF4334 domain-containing protein [Paenibacillus alba]|nr:DUF4334 domain-containing protein [Paenibacillus alba]
MTNIEERLWEIVRNRQADVNTAYEIFDQLEAVDLQTLEGTWEGSEFPTGHPLDGMLTACQWYGKQFLDPDNVHPLLFFKEDGTVFSGDPVQAFTTRTIVATDRPSARMRKVEYRNKVSAAMLYDNLPVIDHYRKVNDKLLLGVMDSKWMAKPYFYYLERG